MGLSFSDEELEKYPYVKPEDVPELVEYVKSRRSELKGFVPDRRQYPIDITTPEMQHTPNLMRVLRAKCRSQPLWHLSDCCAH